jgi:hypothetical protein
MRLDYVTVDEHIAGWILPCAVPAEVSPRDVDPQEWLARELGVKIRDLASYHGPRRPHSVPLADRSRILGEAADEVADETEREHLLRHLLWDRDDPWAVLEYSLFVTELHHFRSFWHAAEWSVSRPVVTRAVYDNLTSPGGLGGARDVHEWREGVFPTVLVDGDERRLRMPVHTPVGSERIYVAEWVIDAPSGRIETAELAILAVLGSGYVF